jgi:predicted transcriptional regulator
MAEQDSAPRIGLDQVIRIVSSYVQRHQIAPDQLVTLIVNVHRALAGLRRSPPGQERLRPAVPIRRSVQRDYVICLECGYHARTLRRHLRRAHGLDIADYRTRWNLPMDHPLIAPSYSARRSTVAKQMGLGRKPGAVMARPPATGRRRRRRPAPEG